MDLFERAKLKGQRLNLTTLLSKPEFKQQYFAPIRALDEDVQVELLTKLIDGEISLQELKGEADKVKQIRALHVAFLRLTNTKTWDEAQQKFPHFATDVQMEKFMLCNLKKSVPKTFLDFCQRAKDSVAEEHALNPELHPFSVTVQDRSITVVNSKLAEVTGQKIRRSTRVFQGAHLAVALVQQVGERRLIWWSMSVSLV